MLTATVFSGERWKRRNRTRQRGRAGGVLDHRASKEGRLGGTVVQRDRLDTTTEHGPRTSGAGRVLPRDAQVGECLELFGRIGRRRPTTWKISLRWPCRHACERASSSPSGRGAWRTSRKRRAGPCEGRVRTLAKHKPVGHRGCRRIGRGSSRFLGAVAVGEGQGGISQSSFTASESESTVSSQRG
jgi:hypothetical protein